MRILFYNWADPFDADKRGGGVTVYQRNLLHALGRQDGIETAMLCAGLAHDLHRRDPHVVTRGQGAQQRHVLVNSGVIAPSHAGYGRPEQLEHAPTEKAFADFVERTGPWDVIHFNNLEGLPANVLSLKDRWPQTKFVLSLHNYYPICPQVNLWFSERETCDDFHAGEKCTRCLVARPSQGSVRMAYATAWGLSRMGMGPGSGFYDGVFEPLAGSAWRSLRRLKTARHRKRDAAHAGASPVAAPSVAPMPAPAPMLAFEAAGAGSGLPVSNAAPEREAPRTPPTQQTARAQADAFLQRRARMVSLINAHCDRVLCVSDRVRQIALTHGIHASRLQTLYIGSAEAGEWHYTKPQPSFLSDDGTLHLAYLGYMRRDKGFHFLMQALRRLPRALASRIHLTVAARKLEAEPVALMEALQGHIATLRHVDGYTHAGLSDLLQSVDMGIVPVIWEDNLPQVAIEMHARHIPLITSDRGGAQELGRCPETVFRAGDAESLHAVLERVLNGGVTPATYWTHAIPPVSLPEHILALLASYRTAS
ncbi:glycosyltransferase [Pararhodobacter sp. CCB-MM2]|uniref:glycosyltransferase n=1 Tax=Pararhodobacter sp. CCB-MM2 TaxID=1786003 RepID=UPI00082A9D38|nr:glycosyltransferase [Pararhodobacter sp. CCB-MM2]